MVTAQLRYNPYLLEIGIKFNGRDPHINSLVYKYQNDRLQDWITRLPEIFRDEMNGYDFRFEISGTRLDYDELQAVFRAQGVSEASVPCVLVKELADRETMFRDIRGLLTWLQNNTNRTFDDAAFRQNHPELLEVSYALILIHSLQQDMVVTHIPGAQVESVAAIHELDGVDLKDIPLVYIVSNESAAHIHEDMRYLLGRSDFAQRQLFFIVARAAAAERTHKFLEDMGIVAPVIISSLDDAVLERYCLLYPVTNYIRNTIAGLRREVQALQEEEAVQRERHEAANREIYAQIADIDHRIVRLKDALQTLLDAQMPTCPQEWDQIEQAAFDHIVQWRSTKFKTTSDKEAVQAAQELCGRMTTSYHSYIHNLRKAAQSLLEQKHHDYGAVYSHAGEDLTYEPYISDVTLEEDWEMPNIIPALMDLKSEAWVNPNDDLFGMLFRQQDQGDRAPVLERTYTYQQWRNYTIGVMSPITAEVRSVWFQKVVNSLTESRQQYESHLSELIERYSQQRAQINAQLSDDEQQFQADVNWLAAFDEQLTRIERG